MRRIQDDTKLVGESHEVVPHRAETVPRLSIRIRGGIAELIVGEVHWPRHPYAQGIKAPEQRDVVGQRIRILDTLENDTLLPVRNARRIGGNKGKFEMR